MCGICGMIGAPDEKVVARMMAALRHRGPDDQGSYCDGRAALGHRRLSIIDLAGGRQPMSDESGKLQFLCNGEIYNFRELRRELAGRGHQLRTQGDCEVILHLYQEMGERCVDKLRGMFAFALWDAPAGKLLLARDRLGIKPLYYAQVGPSFLFASELKALLAHPALPRELDREALDLYLTFRFVPAPWTILRAARKLPPGHVLTLEQGPPTLRRYWRIPEPAEEQPEGAAQEALGRFEALLTEATTMHMVSDVPLGAYLSGGVDSSVVTALMARAAQEPVATFSVGFEEPGHDERSAARSVARFLGTRHRELICRAAPSLDELPRIIWHLDEPVADAAAIPTFQMARLTKQHVTVVLTGEGADELLAGYPYYRLFVQADRRRSLLQPAAGAARLLGRRLGDFLAALADRPRAYLALKSVFTTAERRALLADEPREEDVASDLVAGFLRGGGDFLGQLVRLETSYWLPDDLLLKVDRMTMAHAVEARVPYLDHKVVEFAFRLPSAWKLRGRTGKYLLRSLARKLLPGATARRAKRGFTVPVRPWLERSGLARRLLSEGRVTERGLFRKEAVNGLLKRRLDLFTRRQVWALATLELWCRIFLDRDPTTPPAPGELTDVG